MDNDEKLLEIINPLTRGSLIIRDMTFEIEEHRLSIKKAFELIQDDPHLTIILRMAVKLREISAVLERE